MLLPSAPVTRPQHLLCLKVLEIGGGSGSNFSFVEPRVNWTVTEPNMCFEPYFINNCNEWKDKHDIGKLVQVPTFMKI